MAPSDHAFDTCSSNLTKAQRVDALETACLLHPTPLPFFSVSTLAAAPQPYYCNNHHTLTLVMGNCSSATQDREASQRSANIDRIIEEDSKKLKKECKILLLGKECPLLQHPREANRNHGRRRIGRVWKVDCCQANENHSPRWFLG